MKAIVFGGAGFLGGHVADALAETGYEVIIFDIKPYAYLKENQTMIVGDILNQEEVNKAIEGCDYVYHYAGIADIAEAHNNPAKTFNINILSTVHILEACRKFQVKRFLYASTIYVYSEHGSFYRVSKQSCELFIESFHQAHDVDFTILRYGSLYGNRANHFNFLHNAIKQALLEGQIDREGDGNEIRDYINVIDAARISVKVLDDKFKNNHIMVKGTQTIRIKDLLMMVKEILNNKVDIVYHNDTHMEGHYQITPYTFQPRVAKQCTLDYYHDLGQGVLECIYEVYDELCKEGLKNEIKNYGKF